jgi:sulfatase modifying factor 1
MQAHAVVCLVFVISLYKYSDQAVANVDPEKNMVYVDGGSFIMGTDMNTIDSLTKLYDVPKDFIQSEYPPHKVKIKSFYIDKYEVTNANFKIFIDHNPAWQKANIPDSLHNGHYLEHWNGNDYPTGEGNYPVYNVSWYAAVAYCQWQKKRLPTEAEWEYVASNRGKYKNYSWGEAKPDSSRCNYNNKFGKAIEVGRYPPNGLSVYDLNGNVWEYTLDEWSPTYYEKSPGNNPVNGKKYFDKNELFSVKTRRVIRGGSWGGSGINLRIDFRDSHPVNGAGKHVGFRCVKDIVTNQK